MIIKSRIDRMVARSTKAVAVFERAAIRLDQATDDLEAEASLLNEAINMLCSDRDRALVEAGRNRKAAARLREVTR